MTHGWQKSEKTFPNCRLLNGKDLLKIIGFLPTTGVLTADKALANYYEEVVMFCSQPKAASNWIMGDVMRFLNEEKRDIRQCPITAKSLADMIRLIDEGAISGKMAKEIVEDIYKTGKTPQTIIKEKGLVQITDEGELIKSITSIIKAN